MLTPAAVVCKVIVRFVFIEEDNLSTHCFAFLDFINAAREEYSRYSKLVSPLRRRLRAGLLTKGVSTDSRV
jgi:hypothetical protein